MAVMNIIIFCLAVGCLAAIFENTSLMNRLYKRFIEPRKVFNNIYKSFLNNELSYGILEHYISTLENNKKYKNKKQEHFIDLLYLYRELFDNKEKNLQEIQELLLKIYQISADYKFDTSNYIKILKDMNLTIFHSKNGKHQFYIKKDNIIYRFDYTGKNDLIILEKNKLK